MQHVLYRAAKADPDRRFHALRDKVCREDVLQRAWAVVRRNNGAPGIDKITLADVGEYGVTRLLGELASDLKEGTWGPLPARQVLIPKPGSSEKRPLAIAAVRDRIAQAAVKIVLEPVFEADCAPRGAGVHRVGWETSPGPCRSRGLEAEGSLIREVPGRAGAALTM